MDHRSALLCSLVLGASVLLAPSAASAGPFASEEMGRAATVKLPLTLHVGGALGAGLGRSQERPVRSFLGGGFVEGHVGDVFVLGVGIHVQTLPALAEPLGPRTSALEVRGGIRFPLVSRRKRGAVALPMLALRGIAGVGWLGEPPSAVERTFLRAGVQLAFELVMQRRITPFLAVGYSSSLLEGAPKVQQAEVTLGVSFLLTGDRNFEPRQPARPGRRHGRGAEPSRTRDLVDRLRALDDDEEDDDEEADVDD